MDNKNEIIRKAEKLFLSLGIRSVSMDDISRELGISKKTLYQYFNNKDHLVETVIETHVTFHQHEIEKIIDTSTDSLDELKKISAFILVMIENVSPAAVYDLQKYYRKSWEFLMQQQDEHIFSCFVKNMQKGIGEGLYRKNINPEIVAKIYTKTSYFVVDEVSNPKSVFTRKEIISELYNYHVHAIATPKGLEIWKKYNGETG